MPKKRRSCKNDPDTFCYICGQLTLLKYLRNLTDKIKRLYYAYCGCAVGDQDARLETKIKLGFFYYHFG